jgi:hypothetical protein
MFFYRTKRLDSLIKADEWGKARASVKLASLMVHQNRLAGELM